MICLKSLFDVDFVKYFTYPFIVLSSKLQINSACKFMQQLFLKEKSQVFYMC